MKKIMDKRSICKCQEEIEVKNDKTNFLMPCKKCGYNNGRIVPYGHFQSNQTTYRISCPKCSYCTKEKETVEEAAEAWNRRMKNDS
jgi:hypothetical protein